MKEYSQIQKSISELVIFTLLLQLSGCAEYGIISNNDLPDYRKHNHVIYFEKSKYFLDSTIISNGILSGVIDISQPHTRNAIHVYPLSDSGFKIDTANILSLPLDGIAKVKVPKNYVPKVYVPRGHSQRNKEERNVSAGKTVLVLLYCIIGASVAGSITWYVESQRHH